MIICICTNIWLHNHLYNSYYILWHSDNILEVHAAYIGMAWLWLWIDSGVLPNPGTVGDLYEGFPLLKPSVAFFFFSGRWRCRGRKYTLGKDYHLQCFCFILSFFVSSRFWDVLVVDEQLLLGHGHIVPVHARRLNKESVFGDGTTIKRACSWSTANATPVAIFLDSRPIDMALDDWVFV